MFPLEFPQLSPFLPFQRPCPARVWPDPILLLRCAGLALEVGLGFISYLVIYGVDMTKNSR